MILKTAPGGTFVPRGLNFGGSVVPSGAAPTGWLTAVNADTGVVRWKYHSQSPIIGGVTPTAGGIVMTGDNAGNFLVFDSDSGKPLLKVATGGSIAGAPAQPARATATDATHGKQIYTQTCGVCHGLDGDRVPGKDLKSARSRMSAEQLTMLIKNPAPRMPQIFPEPRTTEDERDLRDLVAYIESWK